MVGTLVGVAALGAGAAAVAARPVAVFEALVRVRLALAGLRSRRGRAGDIDLHFLERPGEDPPVVLLHGLGADAERWFPILPGLLRGRRLLVPSLPAHGRSGNPRAPFGVADLAAWIGSWLAGEVGGTNFDLVGFSMGGWVALQLTLQQPGRIRRLALAASAGLRYEPAPPRRLLDPVSVEDVQELVARLTARPAALPGFVLRDLLRRTRPERRWLVDSALRGEGLVDEHLGSVRVPTLVIWGREDRLLPMEMGRRLARGIQGARWVELPECGHVLYWDCRLEMRRLLEEFLG